MASKTVGEEVTKASIRKDIWDHIENEDLANFPRPVHHRIPNFKGAAEAGDKAAELDVFKDAQTVKINPDKPQEQTRFKTIEDKKELLVSTPRRKSGLFSRIVPPEDADEEKLKICSTAQGVREYSSPIGLEDKVKIDLVIVGSVAVSEKGWRIGKGEGFADLEYAMMASMGAVDENTVIVTTVHDCQVTDIPDHLIENHDIVVDYIVTPTKVIECEHRKKPSGIIWSKITRDKLQQVPILKKLKKIEEEAGKDVTIREDKLNGEADGEDGGKKDGDRRDRGGQRNRRGFYRRQRPRRNRDSESAEGQDNADNKSSNNESPHADDKRGDRPRRPRRPRTRSNRQSEGQEGTSQGEGEDKENMDGDSKPRRRRFRRFNQRRRRQMSNRSDDGNEEEGSETREDNQGSPRGGGERRRQRPRREQRPRRPRRSSDGDDRKERSSGDEDGEERKIRRRQRRQDDNTASIFIGGLPRSVRVSEFKGKVRERGVQPLRVVWRGGNGHAFLVIENKDEADGVVKALQGLSINDKDLRIELSNRSAGKVEGEEGEGGKDLDGQD